METIANEWRSHLLQQHSWINTKWCCASTIIGLVQTWIEAHFKRLAHIQSLGLTHSLSVIQMLFTTQAASSTCTPGGSVVEGSLTSVCGWWHAGSLLRVDVVNDFALKGLDDLALPSALISHQLLVQIVPWKQPVNRVARWHRRQMCNIKN